MTAKRVTYQEFLEIIDLVAIQKNDISFKDGSMYYSNPKNYIAINLGKEFFYRESDTVIEIRTDRWWITIWRNIEHVHIYIF